MGTTRTQRTSGDTKPYSGLDGQYINGTWRPCRRGGTLLDTDPYTGEALAEIVTASEADID